MGPGTAPRSGKASSRTATLGTCLRAFTFGHVRTANAAWLVLAAMAFNPTRAAGCAAGPTHARSTTATIRTQLIGVAARITRSTRHLVLHLPRDWP